MPTSEAKLRDAIALIKPQALKLDDRYFSAEVIIDPDTDEGAVALVRSELPVVLAHETGGPAAQFECSDFTEWGFRRLTLRRRLLPGVYKESQSYYLEQLLDRDVYDVMGRLFRPRYQGAVRAALNVRKCRGVHLMLKFVLYCGRWRICLEDLEQRFPVLVSHLMAEGNELHFCIEADATNEQIWETFQRLASYLDLYLPHYVQVYDPKYKVMSDTLARTSQQGDYRWGVDHVEKFNL